MAHNPIITPIDKANNNFPRIEDSSAESDEVILFI
jgi:hypothetical protein